MKADRALQIISGILSFMMMILISLLVISISLASTVFNIGFISRQMDDEYYDSVLSSLTQTLKDEIAPPSSMPEEVFDGLFNVYSIKEDTQAGVSSILAGIDYSYDSTRVHELLMNRFTQYAQEKKVDIAKTNLDTLADYCVEEYERQISMPVIKSFAPLRLLFDNVFTYALLGMSLLLIVITIFLFKIHTFKHKAVRLSIYILFASALMVIPIPMIFLVQGSYKKINIMPEHIKMLLVSVIQSTFIALLLGGLIIGLLGFSLLPLVKHLRLKAMKGEY